MGGCTCRGAAPVFYRETQIPVAAEKAQQPVHAPQACGKPPVAAEKAQGAKIHGPVVRDAEGTRAPETRAPYAGPDSVETWPRDSEWYRAPENAAWLEPCASVDGAASGQGSAACTSSVANSPEDVLEELRDDARGIGGAYVSQKPTLDECGGDLHLFTYGVLSEDCKDLEHCTLCTGKTKARGGEAVAQGTVPAFTDPSAAAAQFNEELLAWADAYLPTISESDYRIQRLARKEGILHRVIDKTKNPHGACALMREVGILSCLRDCMKPDFAKQMLCRDVCSTGVLTVANVFGAPWCEKMDPRRMVGGMHREAVGVEWRNIELWPVPGEAARYPSGRSKPGKSDIFVIWDVYHGGPGDTPSSPANLLSAALDCTHNGIGYVGTRKFCGPNAGQCGGDYFEIAGSEDEHAEKWVEGTFVRHGGLIRQFSDHTVGSAYVAHPDNDWMFRATSGAGVDWYFMGVRGPYYIFRVSRSQMAHLPRELDPGEDRFAFVQVGTDACATTCLVDRVTAALLQRADTVARGFTRDGVKKQVAAAFGRDFVLTRILSLQPSFYSRLMDDTVHYCLFSGKVEAASRYHGSRVAMAPSERQLRLARDVGDDLDRTWVDGLVRGCREAFGGITTGIAQKHYKEAAVAVGAGLAQVVAHPVVAAYTLWQQPFVPQIAAVASGGLATGAIGVTRRFRPAFSLGADAVSAVHGVFMGVSVASILAFMPYVLVVLVVVAYCWHSLGCSVSALQRSIASCMPGNAQRTFYCALVERRVRGERVETLESRVVVLPDAASLPSTIMHSPQWVNEDEERGRIEITLGNDVYHDVHSAADLLDREPPAVAVMWPLVYMDGNLVLPALTQVSLVHAVNQRFMRAPKYSAVEGVFAIPTRVLAKLVVGEVATRSMEECAKLMGGTRGRRLLRQADNVNQGKTNFKCEMMFKRNETIPLAPHDGDQGGIFKGRMICPIGDANSVLLGESRGMDQLLHEVFDGKPFVIADVNGDVQTVSFFYCSGYTAELLSSMMDFMVNCGHWCIAMCGDDTIGTDGVEFFESDYSMFDSTQSDQLLAAGINVLEGCMTKEWITVFKAIFTGKLRTQARTVSGLEIFLDIDSAMQKSGLASTSWWNFFANALAQVHVIYNAPLTSDLAQAVELGTAHCGFTAKCNVNELSQLTFLKGVFLATPSGYQWMNLPSAVLKLGKMIADPKTIVRAKVHKGSHDMACRVVCHATAAGYARVPEDYPVLGPFLAAYRRIGVSVSDAMSQEDLNVAAIEDWDYKPRMAGAMVQVPRETAMAFICERYDTDTVEVASLEELLNSVTQPGVVVQHPLLLKLGAVDYGC